MSYPTFAAEKVLNELQINSPDDLRYLDEIAWTRGALVRQMPLSSAEARLTIYRDKAVITISSMVSNPQRKRFSIAHELGHLEIHRHRNLLSVCLSDDINYNEVKDAGKQLEQEANEFASAFLLPERFFEPLCNTEDPSLNYIEGLARLFNTSLTATALRYVHYSYEPVALIYSENQHIKWVQQSTELKDLRFFINGRRKLDSTSMAIRQSSKQQHVFANIWFDEGEFDVDAKLMEHSWQMPNHNAILTLLWLDQEIIDEDDDDDRF